MKKFLAIGFALLATLVVSPAAKADTITQTIADRTLRGQATDPMWGGHGKDSEIKKDWDTTEAYCSCQLQVSVVYSTQTYSAHQIRLNYRFYPYGGSNANGWWYGASHTAWWGNWPNYNTVTQAHSNRVFVDE